MVSFPSPLCGRGWPAKQVGRGAVSGFNRLAHGVKNEIAVAEHEIVGKAQHPKALAAQKGIAPFVMRSLFGSVVGSAIQLDDHPGLGTEEIDDVRRDRHLPLELVAVEVTGPNLLPEQVFGPCRDRAETR